MSKMLVFAGLGLVAFLMLRKPSGGEVDFPRRMISQPTAMKTVERGDRIRVLLFTGTEWCPACVHLEKGVIGTPAWREFAAKEIQFRAINVPVDRSRLPASDQRMIQQYGVRSYPTMLVLDRDNEELSRQVGSGPPVENYKAWIRKHQKFY